jgi:mRNA interferase MazF
VWLVRLDKLRPAIVLTRDPMAGVLNRIVLVPVTSHVRNMPSEVLLGPEDGLRRRSVASMDNVQLAYRGDFVDRIGRLQSSKMDAFCEALAFAMGCRRHSS